MKRGVLTLALTLSAVSLLAQTPAAPTASAASAPAVASNVAAVVNGEIITVEQLDRLWNRMGAKMRAQYEKSANGKMGFLENYIGKRLLLQQAIRGGFDKAPGVAEELEAAKESALFDLYVRDAIAAQIVTEDLMRRFYNDHKADFMRPADARVRIITISTANRTVEEARAKAGELMKELYGARVNARGDVMQVADFFAQTASKSSDDPSAQYGGDLGWIARGGLDAKLREDALAMKVGAISGILQTDKGVHLLFVEERAEAAAEPYESAKVNIREYMIAANTKELVESVNKTTRDLRAKAAVTLHPENVQ